MSVVCLLVRFVLFVVNCWHRLSGVRSKLVNLGYNIHNQCLKHDTVGFHVYINKGKKAKKENQIAK